MDPIILKEGVARDFAFGLYELDWDVFGVHIEGAVNLVPKIGETGIKSTVCGPESFTPDHKVGRNEEMKWHTRQNCSLRGDALRPRPI